MRSPTPSHSLQRNVGPSVQSSTCRSRICQAKPGRVDILLGVEILVIVMLHGRQRGTPNSPFTFEIEFGWVLAGGTDSCAPANHVATHYASLLTRDDLLRQFGK